MDDLLSPLTASDEEAPARALLHDPPSIDERHPTDSERFDWIEEDCIIVQEQRAVAVYRNRFNGIVIRQESPDGEDQDAFVVLRDADATRAVVAALQREIRGGR